MEDLLVGTPSGVALRLAVTLASGASVIQGLDPSWDPPTLGERNHGRCDSL